MLYSKHSHTPREGGGALCSACSIICMCVYVAGMRCAVLCCMCSVGVPRSQTNLGSYNKENTNCACQEPELNIATDVLLIDSFSTLCCNNTNTLDVIVHNYDVMTSSNNSNTLHVYTSPPLSPLLGNTASTRFHLAFPALLSISSAE